MAGQYATLMLALRQSPSLTGVSVLFGEENTNAEDATLGVVTVVPVGGPWKSPGFGADGVDPSTEMVWQNDERVDVTIWSAADPNATPPPTEIDNADAVNDLVDRVLQAMQFQQLPGGAVYHPVDGSWYLMGGANNRYGRAYKLVFVVVRCFTTDPPPLATVRKTLLSPITIEAA